MRRSHARQSVGFRACACPRSGERGYKQMSHLGPREVEFGCEGSSSLKGNLMAQSLSGAIKKGDLTAIRAMVAAGAELNPKDKYKAPLLDAVYKSDPAIIETLAEAGANAKIRFDDRSTLLHTPSQKGHTEVVTALLRFGADVNARDCFGRSPLEFAVDARSIETAQALLEHGADANVRNDEGLTPLMIASVNQQHEMVDLLVRCGADPNRKDKEGRTALIWAAIKGKVEILQRLVAGGADPSLKDKEKLTALDHAQQKRRAAAVKYLSTLKQ
jgi:ankyrin repeat protein